MTFQFDTSGVVTMLNAHGEPNPLDLVVWSDLSPFEQGYVEALFADLVAEVLGVSANTLGRARRLALKNGWKWEPSYNGFWRADYHPHAAGDKWADHPSDICALEACEIDGFETDDAIASELIRLAELRFDRLAPATLARIREDCAKCNRGVSCVVSSAEHGRLFWQARQEVTPGSWAAFSPLVFYLDDDGNMYLREGAE